MDPRARGLGALHVLPDELVCYLTSHLEVPELLAFSAASKLARVFALEEPLWMLMHLNRIARRPFEYKVRCTH